MYVDRSAMLAVLTSETEADAYADEIEGARRRITGAHVRLECCVDLARILGLGAQDAAALFDDFVARAKITVVPISDAIARRAFEAWASKDQAQLTFGDCLSKACAGYYRAPMLSRSRNSDVPALSRSGEVRAPKAPG